MLVIGGIGLEFQVAEHHLPGIGVFTVHTGQPPGVIDMTDSTVVAGQDQAHSVFLGNSRRQVERRIDPIPHFIGQQYIGFRIEQGFFRGYVELPGHCRHDLHQPPRSTAGNYIGFETRLVIGNSTHQAPVVPLPLADIPNYVIVGRDHIPGFHFLLQGNPRFGRRRKIGVESVKSGL